MNLTKYITMMISSVCLTISTQSFAENTDACVFRNSAPTDEGERAERVLVVMVGEKSNCIDGKWILHSMDFLSIAYKDRKAGGAIKGSFQSFKDWSGDDNILYSGASVLSTISESSNLDEIGNSDRIFVRSYEANNSVVFDYVYDSVARTYRFYKKMSIPEAKVLRAKDFLH